MVRGIPVLVRSGVPHATLLGKLWHQERSARSRRFGGTLVLQNRYSATQWAEPGGIEYGYLISRMGHRDDRGESGRWRAKEVPETVRERLALCGVLGKALAAAGQPTTPAARQTITVAPFVRPQRPLCFKASPSNSGCRSRTPRWTGGFFGPDRRRFNEQHESRHWLRFSSLRDRVG